MRMSVEEIEVFVCKHLSCFEQFFSSKEGLGIVFCPEQQGKQRVH
jgi:hypothetical protein